MTEPPTIAQLRNLTDRAAAGLTPDEQQRLRDGIDRLHTEREQARAEAALVRPGLVPDDNPATDTDPAPATPDQRKDHTIRGLHAALSRIRNIDRTPPLLDADDAYTRGWQAHHAAVETELLAMPGSEQRTDVLAGLYARWVKAGPPPLGQSISRWWDRRLAELGAALGEEQQGVHRYLSTGCLHGDHAYCQAMTGLNGAKRPGECKHCGAKCRCGCHAEAETAVAP